MCRVAQLSQYQLSASNNACSWSPHYMHWQHISILLCSWFTASVPCMLLLLRTLRSPLIKLFLLVARKFLFVQSAPLFMDLLEFTFIEFSFLLSFLCPVNAVVSADANVPACNSNAQSFSIRKFIVCVLVGIVSQRTLKLSYSFPSVDKIRPISICSDNVFSLCCANSSFRLRNSFCSLATCMLMSSLQSCCAWKNASISRLSCCVLLRSNCAHCLSQMSLALVQVINMRSATYLLSVHAIMLAALALPCCHSASSFFCLGWASAGRTGRE